MSFIFGPSRCVILFLWLSVVSLVTLSVSGDKGPNIIVLGASTGSSSSGLSNPSASSSSSSGSSYTSLGDSSGSAIISSIGGSSGTGNAPGNTGGPSILVLGGDGNGKKNDKKSNVIIIMQPQQAVAAPAVSQGVSSSTLPVHHGSNVHPFHPHGPSPLVLSPSHYPVPHMMSHPALSHFSNPLVSDLLTTSPSTSRRLYSHPPSGSSLASLFASSPMMEENLLKFVNIPRSPSSIAGLKQWLANANSAAAVASESGSSNGAESLATSSSDLSDYFTPAYSF